MVVVAVAVEVTVLIVVEMVLLELMELLAVVEAQLRTPLAVAAVGSDY